MGSSPVFRVCSAKDCVLPHYGNGFCNGHNARFKKGQDLYDPPLAQHNRSILPCIHPKCDAISELKKMCRRHAFQMQRHSDPAVRTYLQELFDQAPKTIQELYLTKDFKGFLKFVEENSTKNQKNCWVWNGCKDKKGYGALKIRSKNYQLHRIVFEVKFGEKIGIETIHHKCSNTSCINPDHLQKISNRENVAEMMERNFYINRIAELEAENIVLRAALSLRSEHA